MIKLFSCSIFLFYDCFSISIKQISATSIFKFLSLTYIARPEMSIYLQPVMFTTKNAISFAQEINLGKNVYQMYQVFGYIFEKPKIRKGRQKIHSNNSSRQTYRRIDLHLREGQDEEENKVTKCYRIAFVVGSI